MSVIGGNMVSVAVLFGLAYALDCGYEGSWDTIFLMGTGRDDGRIMLCWNFFNDESSLFQACKSIKSC